jgi:hypothetical protein
VIAGGSQATTETTWSWSAADDEVALHEKNRPVALEAAASFGISPRLYDRIGSQAFFGLVKHAARRAWLLLGMRGTDAELHARCALEAAAGFGISARLYDQIGWRALLDLAARRARLLLHVLLVLPLVAAPAAPPRLVRSTPAG